MITGGPPAQRALPAPGPSLSPLPLLSQKNFLPPSLAAFFPAADGSYVSMGVYSDGSYGAPKVRHS